MEQLLTRSNYETAICSNADTATRMASEHTFDAAIVDYDLGAGITGLQVFHELRRMQPSCLRILMTGHTEQQIIVEALNDGAVHHALLKPITANRLNRALSEAFETFNSLRVWIEGQARAVEPHAEARFAECMDQLAMHLAYQPIVTPDGEPFGYEALLRPDHPHFDSSPLSLLKVAEHLGRINDLADAIFDMAQRGRERMPADARLFVNLHPAQLTDRERLRATVGKLLPVASQVVLELTERRPLENIAGWEQAVAMLTDLGFDLAIDDLGGGYNSLWMLADLRPRFIKLDMRLVRGIDIEPRKQRLVQMITAFADATNSLVVGEGAETAQEVQALVTSGAHLIQGYYFGRPGPLP